MTHGLVKVVINTTLKIYGMEIAGTFIDLPYWV